MLLCLTFPLKMTRLQSPCVPNVIVPGTRCSPVTAQALSERRLAGLGQGHIKFENAERRNRKGLCGPLVKRTALVASGGARSAVNNANHET